jgi:hypothetical protein
MWMVVPAPVILLMIEMGLVPPSTAVADDRGVSEIVLAFTASVITAPPRPAFRPAHTARMTLPGSSTECGTASRLRSSTRQYCCHTEGLPDGAKAVQGGIRAFGGLVVNHDLVWNY